MGKTWNGSGRISGKADALAALQRVNETARSRGNLALVPQPVTTGDQASVQGDVTGVLPCDFRLQPLLPWPGGLRKGATVAAVGSTSLLMLLLAGAMRDTGSWGAVVGAPMFGGQAAAEAGIPVDRLALVPEPGPDWPQIVSALIDGVDVVAVQPPPGAAEGVLKSLSARARQKGCVLLPTKPWAGAELTLDVTGRHWHGLGNGRGRLRHCELDVQATGRGRAVRPKRATITVAGEPIPPIVVPPAPPRPVEPVVADTGRWAHLEPSPLPADPWAGLTRTSYTAPNRSRRDRSAGNVTT
ncbi:hypothetical protein [Actinoplanes missouriensis]|nr:hypothetical protein [Actinoplanes missouriensis]